MEETPSSDQSLRSKHIGQNRAIGKQVWLESPYWTSPAVLFQQWVGSCLLTPKHEQVTLQSRKTLNLREKLYVPKLGHSGVDANRRSYASGVRASISRCHAKIPLGTILAHAKQQAFIILRIVSKEAKLLSLFARSCCERVAAKDYPIILVPLQETQKRTRPTLPTRQIWQSFHTSSHNYPSRVPQPRLCGSQSFAGNVFGSRQEER